MSRFKPHGYARAKRDNKVFYIDRSGREYSVAEKVEDILPGTQIINLHNKKLKEIPSSIFSCTNLRVLILSNNKIDELPPEIGLLTKLEKLDFGYKYSWFSRNMNSISKLPPEIGKLKNLSYLGLTGNNLSLLPREIGDLTNLSTLFLGSNELVLLPEEIGKLRNLCDLDISYNKLQTVPRNLMNPPLVSVYLEGNDLLELSSVTQALTFVQFNYQITSFYSDVSYPHICTLYFPKNIKIDSTIGDLKNCTTLDLWKIKIPTLPVEIAKLKKVEDLTLYENSLTEFPIIVCEMESLIYLEIANNNLTKVPDDITKLKELKSLTLTENNFSDEEKERIRRLMPDCEVRF